MPVKCLSWRDWPLQSRIHARNPPIFLCWVVKIDYVRSDVGHGHLITAVKYYLLSDMGPGDSLMKSFAGFLHIVVVRRLSACSWRSLQRFCGSLIGILEVTLDNGNAYLLHGKFIKNRLLVYASVWNGHGTVIVALWYMIKRSDGGKYLWFFENSSRAVAKRGKWA